MELETALARALKVLETAYERTRNLPSGGPLVIQGLVERAIADCGPTHYLVVKALQFLALWSASQVEPVGQVRAVHGRLAGLEGAVVSHPGTPTPLFCRCVRCIAARPFRALSRPACRP